MCCTRLAANTGRKKVAKNRHLGTIAQLHRAISSQLRHVSTSGKNLLNSNISSTIWRTSAHNGWDRFTSLGHSCKFQRVSRPGSVHGTPVVGISRSLRRWTEGATYIQQGGHYVGHWPTFLVQFEMHALMVLLGHHERNPSSKELSSLRWTMHWTIWYENSPTLIFRHVVSDSDSLWISLSPSATVIVKYQWRNYKFGAPCQRSNFMETESSVRLSC